jgi:hypothetical protein
MVNDLDQMLMGERFIWYYWSEATDAKLSEDEEYYIFKGTIKAFGHLSKSIRHTRTVKKKKGTNSWLVLDELQGLPPQHRIRQLWHTAYPEQTELEVLTGDAELSTNTGWFSTYYGTKKACIELEVVAKNKQMQTLVQAK